MRLVGGREPDSKARIDRMARYGVPPEILSSLHRYLHQADDRELYRVNPRYVAAKIGTDTHSTLSVLAYAVVEGLFELNWEVHCPQCGQMTRNFFTLNDARGEEFCASCQANFAAHLDHEIHVTFTVNETLRKLSTPEPIQDEQYPPTYGLELLNVQTFRDLFADQVLPPGESLKVKRVAFVFTDLRGSTAMYAREGDPQAYGWVRDHFAVLFQATERNRGVTVKTIGDAVMASFLEPVNALRTAMDMHRDMAELNRRLGLSGDAALSVRLGAHVGPCISVTLNDKLDYFGATVNIAARVSHLSRGYDVVLTEAMLEDGQARAEAARHGELESFETELRGFDQQFRLHRLPVRE